MKPRDFIGKFLNMKGNARNIARGVALGTFVGMTPFPGFRMVIAMALARLFRVNVAAAAMFVYINNALTGLFISAFHYYIGMKVLMLESLPEFPRTNMHDVIGFIFHSGLNVFLSLAVGGVLTGIPLAAMMYFITYSIFKRRDTKSGVILNSNRVTGKELVFN